MKAKLLMLCFVSATTALAADSPAEFNSTLLPPIQASDPSRWKSLLTEKRDSPVIALGKSDFVIRSPLIEGFRPLRHSEDLSLGQKFLRLPIIRLFVPLPMERPPGTGKYFKWRSDTNPVAWPLAASRPKIEKGPQ
jgi:hypothetical protein